ncbi:MAG: replicative DNA helicase [Deltaproteobacteria bacterium]|nr:replicative DNA helicase [Deltaproteobacteria bacterium]
MAEAGTTPLRQPPNDPAAEQGVLGGVLVHGADVMAGVATLLAPEDFYDRRHGRIYQAMLTLYNKGQPVDEITVTSRLRDEGHLENVGGAAFVAELANLVLSPAHVDHYAQLVRDKGMLRNFIRAAVQAADEAYTQQADPDQALEAAEKAIFAATQARLSQEVSSIGEVVRHSLAAIERLFQQKGQVSGVTTGFKRLDQLTTGLQPGDLIIIAGRPSMGKTAFALNIAANAAVRGNVPVAVFSLEMSKEQLGMRLLCGEARVSGGKIRSGFLSQNQDWPALIQAADLLSRSPIFIDDTPALAVLEMRAKARRLKAEHKLGLIVVDYLQLMRGRAGSDSREQEISDISRSLKALAKELDLPVVALSQLNRKVEDRPRGDRRPQLSDLRESGAIEQDADVVAFIYRKKAYKKADEPEEADDNVAEIIIGKQRNGPTGTVKLAFLDELTKFEDLTYDPMED